MAGDEKKYMPGWRDRKLEGQNARTRSKYVSTLKIVLPIIAALGLLVIMVWPTIQSYINTDAPATKRIHQMIKSQPTFKNTAVNPEYISNDKKGRPYAVRAKTAVHSDADTTELDHPTGDFKIAEDDSASFSAKTGHYVKSKNHLNLVGDVHVSTKKGYDLYTQSADIDVKENSGEGDEPVNGTGPLGETISSQGFQISNKGDTVTFKGKTKITMPAEGK